MKTALLTGTILLSIVTSLYCHTPTPDHFNATTVATPSIVEEDEYYESIPISDLSKSEQDYITTSTVAFLEEFLTQSSSESATNRAQRLAPFLTSDNIIGDIDLYPLFYYTSKYTIVGSTKPVPDQAPKVEWSIVSVSDAKASTYIDIDVLYTDINGSSTYTTYDQSGNPHLVDDIVTERWFVDFHKVKTNWYTPWKQWRIYNIEKAPPPPK